MTEYTHQPCPYTDCGSSDAFSWNDEGYGKCFSCNEGYPKAGKSTFEWVAEKYPVKKKVNNKNVEPTYVTYENIRGLDEDVAKLYGIQRQLDDDREWLRDAFRYPSNIKYRTPDKKFYLKNKGIAPLDLFGPEFNAGSSKRIYITEGEYDAASLFQILGKSFPVKSLPSASIGDKFIKHNHAYLDSFEQIVYAGEQSDNAGLQAAERLYQAYPSKFFYVPMSKWKDANEFLEKGDGDELKWAALKPQRYSPDNFFCSTSEFLKILHEENPYEATPTGHTGIDYMTRGLVRGGVTFIKAPPGSGKTELVRFFERAMLETDDTKIGLIHMEEMKSTTLRCMATYELGVNVRTEFDQTESGVTDEQLDEAVVKATKDDRTIIFEMRSHDDPLKIVEYCRLACGVYGADYVFIDHVQRLTYLGGTDGATNILTQIGSNLAQLAKEMNVGIIVISHVNEDGHTKYAKSLEEEAIICLKIERDRESEDEIIQNTTKFHVEKNRPFSRLGPAGMVYYDPVTTLLSEVNYEL